MPNYRTIKSFLTDLEFFHKLANYDPLNPLFLSLDQKTYFTNIFYIGLGTLMPNFRFFN